MQSTKVDLETSQTSEENQSTTTETPATENTVDPAVEETKKMIAQWAQRGHKPLLFVPPLSQNSANALNVAVEQLAQLKEKIASIRTEVNEQHEHISGRLAKLKDNPILQVDSENKQAAESVSQYSALLDRILEEISFETTQLERYASLDAQTALPVPFHESDDFDTYIKNKVSRVKKQVKKISKDLDVSFSRYTFSFDKQCKNLLNIESLVSYNLKLREHQEKIAAEKKEANADSSAE